MISGEMRKIGILIERERAWGRLLCEGIAGFAQTRGDWALTMLEREDLRKGAYLRNFDGFIARVSDAKTAAAFAAAKRPVADVSCEQQETSLFARAIAQNNLAVGQLAARHFIEHHFANYAFCGYDAKRFSNERRDAYVRCLKLNHFDCAVYASPAKASRSFDDSVSRHERLGDGADAADLRAWLKRLPKPVAVFCANDLRSYQLLQACRACKIDVPHEVAILGVDNDSLVCNFTTPTLSSIDPNALELGRSAADCLAQILDGPAGRRPTLRKIRPSELVVRASSETYPLDPPWLSDALVFIRRNVVRHLTAADVYSHLQLSHTRVNACFREKLGTTVQREIRAAQLAEAKRLLKNTSLPLAEIAKRAGFATPQYFCNVFTDAFGRAPSKFR